MPDACLQYEGTISLLPIIGCSVSTNDKENYMIGIWTKKDKTHERVCWKFDKIIFVYTKNKDLTFKPEDQEIGCPTLGQIMNNEESHEIRKEKLLRRLNSLSPVARMAILKAAMELRQERKEKLQGDHVRDDEPK